MPTDGYLPSSTFPRESSPKCSGDPTVGITEVGTSMSCIGLS